MSIIDYKAVITSDGGTTLILIDENLDTVPVTESHPNFVRILSGLQHGEDVSEWLDGSPVKVLVSLSDRVTVEDDVLHFDGDPVYDGLSDTIMRYRREGRDPSNLVKFMERLSANPSRRSREQLFTWTQAKDLTIDTDGYIVGFKGVRERTADTPLLPLERYPYQSSSSGHGIVDGVEIKSGHLPMGVGAVISIPREEVQDDPTIGCHVGLHVGTHSYATSFAPVLVEVRFDPADVVSVPSDSGFAKLRCCKYEVVAVHELEDDDLSEYEPESSWDEDEAMDGFNAFMEYAPSGWVSRMIDRVKGRSRTSG